MMLREANEGLKKIYPVQVGTYMILLTVQIATLFFMIKLMKRNHFEEYKLHRTELISYGLFCLFVQTIQFGQTYFYYVLCE